MKSILILAILGIASLGALSQSNELVEVATDTIATSEDLDFYVNKFVTIKGEISGTKIPQIMGVDVSCDGCNSKDKMGIATGILIKTTVLEKDIDPYTQNRGAGTFFRLKDPNSQYDAKVTVLKK